MTKEKQEYLEVIAELMDIILWALNDPDSEILGNDWDSDAKIALEKADNFIQKEMNND